jgi:hypothetical protein
MRYRPGMVRTASSASELRLTNVLTSWAATPGRRPARRCSQPWSDSVRCA